MDGQGRQQYLEVNGAARQPHGADVSEAEASEEDAPLTGGKRLQPTLPKKAAASSGSGCCHALLACTSLFTLLAAGAMIALRVALPQSLFRETHWERAPDEAFGATGGSANPGWASLSGAVPMQSSSQIHNLDVVSGAVEGQTSSGASSEGSVQTASTGAGDSHAEQALWGVSAHADLASERDGESSGTTSKGQQTPLEVSSQVNAPAPEVAESSDATSDISSQANAQAPEAAANSDDTSDIGSQANAPAPEAAENSDASSDMASQAKAPALEDAKSSGATSDMGSQANAPAPEAAKSSDTSFAVRQDKPKVSPPDGFRGKPEPATLNKIKHVCTPPPAFPRQGSSGCQAPPIPAARRLDSQSPWSEERRLSINGSSSMEWRRGSGSVGATTTSTVAEQRRLMVGEGEKWLEEIIAGRGPYADEIKRCASANRRRSGRHLRSGPAAAAADMDADEDALSEALEEAGAPPLERRLEDKGWYLLAGREYMVAEDEGENLGRQAGHLTLEQCQSQCKATDRCNSISYCRGNKVCWLKGGAFKGDERIRPNQACSTYYWGPKFNGPPRPTPRPEDPQQAPERKWCAPPSGQDVERYMTTWRCISAFGSQYEAKRKACHFRNLYYEGWGKDGFFVAHVVKGCNGALSKAELDDAHISMGVGSGFSDQAPPLRIKEHASLQALEKDLAKGQSRRIVEQSGLTLAFGPVYHFNVGHGLFDGLYPAFVSLLQLGLQATPFRAFVLSGWLTAVERQVPGMYAKVEDMFGSIGGLGALTKAYAGFGGTKESPVLHRFEELVIGSGTNSQKLDMNPNVALGACRELDACRAFRQHVFDFHGVPFPPSVRRSGPFRAIVIQNKRYGDDLEKITEELQEATRPGGVLQDFTIDFVKWSPGAPKKGSQSLQTGNFTRHLEILSDTDVHISAPGTGQMYQTFLSDGAVHINIGENRDKRQGYMEEYMAEGAPYLRALYYPKRKGGAPTLEASTMVKLLQQARKLLLKGPEGPAPVGSNLSPVGKLFKAYCYWAHREKFGLDLLSKGHILLREIKGETWMGNSFPEDLVYSGAPHEPGTPFKPDSCLIGALRASFDQTHPELGLGNHGWFGTSGKLKSGN